MLMSTFSGLRDAARSVYPFLPAPLVPNAYPNERRIRTLRAPVLIMHGDQDELLPLRSRNGSSCFPGPGTTI
jgi:pimeloyl-ACP methyl ester carboxylesterase